MYLNTLRNRDWWIPKIFTRLSLVPTIQYAFAEETIKSLQDEPTEPMDDCKNHFDYEDIAPSSSAYKQKSNLKCVMHNKTIKKLGKLQPMTHEKF